jgi:Uri superfamily endonuclease
MKGSYILLLELPEQREITVGRLGLITFPKGCYAYVGSALNGLKPRITRHLRKEKSRHWHIDCLLPEAEVWEIIIFPSEERRECLLAQSLALGFQAIPGFGSSDCKCKSHLYFDGDRDKLRAGIIAAAEEAGLAMRIVEGSDWRNGI